MINAIMSESFSLMEMLYFPRGGITCAHRKVLNVGLYTSLQKAKSEEDVKDAYIKVLGLKSYSKNIIDIQTKEVWFEAKANGSWTFYEMFTQLLHYVWTCPYLVERFCH
ncbi:hypothetical protein ABE530_15705 [Brucella sp. TWI559]